LPRSCALPIRLPTPPVEHRLLTTHGRPASRAITTACKPAHRGPDSESIPSGRQSARRPPPTPAHRGPHISPSTRHGPTLPATDARARPPLRPWPRRDVEQYPASDHHAPRHLVGAGPRGPTGHVQWPVWGVAGPVVADRLRDRRARSVGGGGRRWDPRTVPARSSGPGGGHGGRGVCGSEGGAMGPSAGPAVARHGLVRTAYVVAGPPGAVPVLSRVQIGAVGQRGRPTDRDRNQPMAAAGLAPRAERRALICERPRGAVPDGSTHVPAVVAPILVLRQGRCNGQRLGTVPVGLVGASTATSRTHPRTATVAPPGRRKWVSPGGPTFQPKYPGGYGATRRWRRFYCRVQQPGPTRT